MCVKRESPYMPPLSRRAIGRRSRRSPPPHRQQRHLEADRPEGDRYDQEIQMDRPERRRDGRGEELLGGTLRQEPPQQRVQKPAQHETRQRALRGKIADGGDLAPRSAAPLDGVRDAVAQRLARRRWRAAPSSSASACCAQLEGAPPGVLQPARRPRPARITSATCASDGSGVVHQARHQSAARPATAAASAAISGRVTLCSFRSRPDGLPGHRLPAACSRAGRP